MLDNTVKRSGLSYNKLAENADMDFGYVYRICKGDKRGSRDALIRLCAAMTLEVGEYDVILLSRGYAELGGRRKKHHFIVAEVQTTLSADRQRPEA